MDESDITRQLRDTSAKLTAMAAHFAYYTECQLATLEHLEMVKSTPKSRLKRHQSICEGMVNIVRNYNLKDLGPQVLKNCPRLVARL